MMHGDLGDYGWLCSGVRWKAWGELASTDSSDE